MRVDPLDKAGYRKFGLVMAVVIALLFGLFFPFVLGKNLSYWPWLISGLFFLSALLLPMQLALIYKPWMILGHILGTVNTKIILGIVFFLIFTPVALVFKALGKDPMRRQLGDTSLTSYWQESQKQSKEHMEKVY